jgi:hypothetical protein
MMFEIQFFIPLKSNQGETFTDEHHAQFERAVLDRFGGVTLMPGTVEGQWMEEGIPFHDSLRVYLIAAGSITQGALIGELAAIAKAHYGQLAVYVRYFGVSEIL